jgi:hypothetical protein
VYTAEVARTLSFYCVLSILTDFSGSAGHKGWGGGFQFMHREKNAGDLEIGSIRYVI